MYNFGVSNINILGNEFFKLCCAEKLEPSNVLQTFHMCLAIYFQF